MLLIRSIGLRTWIQEGDKQWQHGDSGNARGVVGRDQPGTCSRCGSVKATGTSVAAAYDGVHAAAALTTPRPSRLCGRNARGIAPVSEATLEEQRQALIVEIRQYLDEMDRWLAAHPIDGATNDGRTSVEASGATRSASPRW